MSYILHVVTGEKLKISNNQLVVIKDDEKHHIDLENLECIVIESMQCSISVSVHNLCAKSNIPIIICNEKHQPEVFCHNLYGYFQLTSRIRDQIQWIDNGKIICAYKKIIKRKLDHQYELLNVLDKQEDANKLIPYIEKVNCTNKEIIIENSEAVCARIYFRALFGVRFKRMAYDNINAGLNYGYSMLRSVIMMQIVAKGFHPSIGLFHHSIFNNYNLADDLIEVYRPMVDYIVYLTVRMEKEFTKKHRQNLQQVIQQKVKMNNSVVSFKNSVRMYLDNIYKFMDGNSDIIIPGIEVQLYQY